MSREKIITDNMLSEYQIKQKEFLGLKSDKVEKLICDLIPKKNYICHYANLKLYIELGYNITKVHKILFFSQEPWLAPYINKNTNLRKDAKNDFEKDFF